MDSRSAASGVFGVWINPLGAQAVFFFFFYSACRSKHALKRSTTQVHDFLCVTNACPKFPIFLSIAISLSVMPDSLTP